MNRAGPARSGSADPPAQRRRRNAEDLCDIRWIIAKSYAKKIPIPPDHVSWKYAEAIDLEADRRGLLERLQKANFHSADRDVQNSAIGRPAAGIDLARP